MNRLKSRINNLLVGQILQERYQIIEVLNNSAFSQTYLAVNFVRPDLPKCIIKFYRYQNNSSHIYITSKDIFLQEIKTLEKLSSHAQTPQLIDYFEQENQGFYLVQNFIEGQFLSASLAQRKQYDFCWREKQVWHLLHNILGILQFIHNQGIIHCDLQPSNIIKRSLDNNWVILDFSSAQLMSSLSKEQKIEKLVRLKTKTIINPSGYLAPEQLISQPHISSDIYALGIIAIQALTGIEPKKLQLDFETGELIWQCFLPQQKTRSEFSENLLTVIEQMVSYKIENRYQAITEVIQDLEEVKLPEKSSITVFGENQWPGVGANPLKIISKQLPNSGNYEVEECNKTPKLEFKKEILREEYAENSNLEQKIKCDKNITLKKNYSDQESKITPVKFSKLMPLVAGIGITILFINAWTVSFGRKNLPKALASDLEIKRLLKADQAYQQGNLKKAIALAQSISKDSSVYEESQIVIEEWQQEWQQASKQFELVEKAFQQKKWQNVLKEAQKMPDIFFWQEKQLSLVEQAKLKIEQYAHQLLQIAFDRAGKKDFSTALKYLEQIPQESILGEKVKMKLIEYRKKQQIRAGYHLQQAFKLAENRNFKEAIELLHKIPHELPLSAIAKTKIVEYTEKQQIRELLLKKKGLKVAAQKRKNQLVSFFKEQKTKIANSELNPGNMLQEISPQAISS